MNATLDDVARWACAADAIVILTGAGISTESGIPDFRGPSGVWTKNPAAERASTLSHYVSDPEVRRASWQSRLHNPMLDAAPNAGHRALAELEQVANVDTLVTQNIDRLHHAAGSSPERIVEIHGNAHEVMCLSCARRDPMQYALDRVRAGEDDPHCEDCGGIIKSATISFGQNLEMTDIERAHRAAMRADLYLALGTKLTVFPAADFPAIAKANGARLVIMNAEPTPLDTEADAVFDTPLGTILPDLVARVAAIPA